MIAAPWGRSIESISILLVRPRLERQVADIHHPLPKRLVDPHVLTFTSSIVRVVFENKPFRTATGRPAQ